MSFYRNEELQEIGLGSFGNNVLISKKTSLYNPSKIHIGNNVRLDDYCVLSAGEGGITIGSYVHIAVFCSLMGAGKITLSDFSGLSSRVSIYSSNDDYSGTYLTNPTVPDEYRGVTSADVYVGKHTIIGAGSVILPGVVLEDGISVSSLSLVTKRCTAFGVYSGNRRINERNQNLLILEQDLLSKYTTY
ncbi:MAG: galactoside O-acetyltransferase [Geobacter sp.]|nr:MAG: galactoside O-acetyltransferase [Geobacter sp.]